MKEDKPALKEEKNSPKGEKKIKIEISKEKLKKALKYIFLPLIFMALGAFAFYFYQSFDKAQDKIPESISSPAFPTPSPTATAKPTPKPRSPKPTSTVPSNWKTYKAGKFGIEFKYPSGWLIFEPQNYVQIMNYDPDQAAGRDYIPSLDADYFKIEIVINKKYSDVDQWFSKRKYEPNPINDQLDEFFNLKEITVDSYPGIFFETISPMSGTKTSNATFETPYGYLVHFWGALNYEGHKSYYNQILSTVKFID